MKYFGNSICGNRGYAGRTWGNSRRNYDSSFFFEDSLITIYVERKVLRLLADNPKSRERIVQDQRKRPRVEGNIALVPILFSPENQNNESNVVKISGCSIWNRFLESCHLLLCCWCEPPIHVTEGFFRRICRNHDIDKVALVKKGVYVVRFTTTEKRDLVFTGNPPSSLQ